MASTGRKAMRGRLARVTRVDACGRVVYGDDSQAVSKGWISAAWTANTAEVAAIEQDNANGEPLIREPAKTRQTGFTLSMTFGEVDPEFFSLVTGQRVYLDENGDAIGFAINTDVDLGDRGFALEIWAGAPTDANACLDPNAQGTYGYFLAPFLKGGILGDYTIENGAVTFTIQGATTQDGNAWGVGPYNVMLNGGVPSPLLTPLEANDHKLLIWVTVAPPAPFYGTRPVLDPDSTAITAVVVTEGAGPTEAEFTFTGAGADPVWIDFGDGEWDYVEAGTSGASHTYATNGSYPVRASSNGTWVTASAPVVIPFP